MVIHTSNLTAAELNTSKEVVMNLSTLNSLFVKFRNVDQFQSDKSILSSVSVLVHSLYCATLFSGTVELKAVGGGGGTYDF